MGEDMSTLPDYPAFQKGLDPRQNQLQVPGLSLTNYIALTCYVFPA